MFCKVVIYFGILLASEIVLAEYGVVHSYQYTAARRLDREIAKKDHFVMFYTEWCRWSQELFPTWEQLAERINGIYGSPVRIAKVDCKAASRICSRKNISKYPTLRYFKRVNSRTWFWEYKGSRDLESLMSFINLTQSADVPLR